MSDDRGMRGPTGPTSAEQIDGVVRKLVTAIVIAGAIIGLAIYSQDGPPRYQVAADGERVYRINTDSGTVIACEGDKCAIVLQRGQELLDALPVKALPAPAPGPAVSAGNEAAAIPAKQ